GKTTEPAAVYVRQEGFLRSSAAQARDMAEQADRIAALIGTHGNGPAAATALPVEALFPAASLTEPRSQFGPKGQDMGPAQKQYHRGLSAFTLTFSRKAVADIVSAPAGVILKAYAQSLGASERALMDRVLPLLSFGADGRVRYDESKALKALGYWSWNDQGARSAMSELSQFAQTAADVVRDLAAAAAAPNAQERAVRFLAVMDGDGRSGLAYDDVMRVLVQLADPADVSGEFYVTVDKGIKGDKDVDARLLLNKKAPDGELIGGASRNRARFAEPSILTD
ncbi:MAG: hypothetical protein KGL53_16695, partial [Elusimicrobia bacterium]|nr:hypothetical protein [Elusimicrobiota bacterium]